MAPDDNRVIHYDWSQVGLPDGYTREELASLEFLDAAQDVVLYGQTGRGKTHLAIAIGAVAVARGKAVRFYTAAELAFYLGKASREHTLEAAMRDVARNDLLILGEFGYVPLDLERARLLFQVVSDCYERRSLVTTTNIEFSKWSTVLRDDKKVEVTRRVGLVLDCSARCDVPVYVFEYHETRRKGVAQEFLAGWSGTLTADGYKPHFNLGNPNIANTACPVHVRRYFAQIVKIAGGDVKAASAVSVALEARRRIDAMFKVDSKFDDMEPGARKAARDAELRPLMEDFGGWARAQLPLASPKLAPHRALQYAVEFWPYVMNVLEDGAPGALEQRRRAGPANLRRRAQELALQRCAARRAGVCGDIQRHHHGQGQRAQSQALRRVAADRDAQRRRAHR